MTDLGELAIRVYLAEMFLKQASDYVEGVNPLPANQR